MEKEHMKTSFQSSNKFEPLKDKDIIRGMIINADEYKTDEIISQNKIEAKWVNTENLISAVEWYKYYKDNIDLFLEDYPKYENELHEKGILSGSISNDDVYAKDGKKYEEWLLDKAFQDVIK